jgi:hypothetical protein
VKVSDNQAAKPDAFAASNRHQGAREFLAAPSSGLGVRNESDLESFDALLKLAGL